MRRGLAWFAAVVGTLMALVGLVVAVVVGPDDTVSRSPHGLPAAGAKATMAYSSWPDLFPYRDLTLVVTARGGGSVFVGTANPLDAASYADGVRAYRFSEVSGSGRITGGRASEDTAAQPSVAPAKATFWVDKTSAARKAQLRVPLDGSPLSVVAVAERGPLTLGFGVRLAGLFWTAVAVLLVGLALLSYGVWRLRRRPTDEASAVRAGGVTGGGVALLLLASGCGWVPQAVEPEPATKVPMTKAQLKGVLDDYDRRNNAAVKAAETRLDDRLWAQADTGSALVGDLFDTKLQRLKNKKGDGTGRRSGALQLYAPTDTAYPLTFVATSEPPGKKLSKVDMAVFSQECVTCSWKLAATSTVARGSQPTPRAPGIDSNPTSEQRATAKAVQADLTRYATTKRLRLLPPTAPLKKFTASLTPGKAFQSKVEAGPYAEDPQQLARVQGGALAIFQHQYTQKVFAKGENNSVGWTDEALGAALGQTGYSDYVTQSGVLTTVVSLPDRGDPVALDASWRITGP